MELLQLRYFLEVACSQHITRSAEKLHIAQPSLSQSIKRLENELGVPLFASRGRNIELTEYGKFLRDQLQPLMQKLDALPRQLQEMADPRQTTIHLHVTTASMIVSEAIIEYRRLHENVNFQFLLGEDASLFDVCIESRMAGSAPGRDQEGCFSLSEKFYLAVPDAPRFDHLHRIRLQDFREAPFISLIASRHYRRLCDRFCAEAGFTPHIAFESDSPDIVRNMIAAHMGVGFWPAFSWGRLRGDGMRLLDISEPMCRRNIVIRLQKNRIDSRIVEDFYSFLCDYFMDRMMESYSDANPSGDFD